MNTRKELKAEAIATLKRSLVPGAKVYTQVEHVAKSGMSRDISVVIIKDNEPRTITHLVAWALDLKRNEHNGGAHITGCGMDMCFEIVYQLGRTLYPDGFECPGESCHSNDHSNGDRNYDPHHHKDGGYALRQHDLT
jgi:hypothetical protein